MPVTIDGTSGITSPAIDLTTTPLAVADGGTGLTAGENMFRNRIINGDMRIDQRNAGASVTPSNSYTLDRWRVYTSQASKLTAQQNAGSVTPPAGFVNYLGITSSSAYSITSTDYFFINQNIEGFNISDLAWGTANAQAVTLSFWVRSSLTGTFGGSLQNATSNRSYPFSYTISVANTWEYKTITIAGDTSGTWVSNTNGVGIQLALSLGTGSTYSGTAGSWASSDLRSITGATSVVGTNGATFYITGVQLEKGSTATSFDYRPYGTELALCQRYYWQRNGETSYAGIGSGTMNSATVARIFFNYPVSMRATPTISVTSIGNTIIAQGGTDLTPSGITPYANSTGAMADITTNAGTLGRGAVWLFNLPVSASVQATAEL